MIKLLMGGSPCTYWSIAQTKNRETEASGMGWELFKNYLIAIEKYQPDYFLYENNKSMSAAIREQITKEFGFEPVMIDSALVSAQSRKRLYWLGRREPDGTYSRVNVEMPEDRGILLRDILETGVAFREKAYTLDANYHKTTGVFNPKKQHSYSRLQAAEPINTTVNGKGFAVKAHYGRTGITEMLGGGGYYPASGVAEMVCENKDGQFCLLAMDGDEIPTERMIEVICDGENRREVIKTPCGLRYERTETAKKLRKDYEAGRVHHGFNEHRTLQPRPDGKSNTLSTVLKDTMVIEQIRQAEAIPLNMTETGKAQCLRATCYKDGIRNMIANEVDRRTCVAEPVRVCNIDGGSQGNRIYSVDAKSCAIKANSGGLGGHGQGLYAEPVRIGTIESDAKNPGHDSQQYRVYGPDGKSVTLCGAGGVLEQRPGFMQCRSAGANACPGGNQAGICRSQAGGMCGLVHVVQQDEEGQTNEQ